MTGISPCVHPNCELPLDEDGNKSLIQEVMCPRCQRLLRKDLDEIVKDYVRLKSSLPTPARRADRGLRHTVQSFGHQAEDASAACEEMASMLNEIEAQLRERVGDLPAPEPVRTSGLSLVRTHEPLLVNHAYAYLRGRFEQLVQWPGEFGVGYHAGALHETHQTNRRVYGLTRHVERLELPCPGCDVVALVCDVSLVHSTGGQPPPIRYTCEQCGRSMDEEERLSRSLMRIAWEMRMYEAEIASTEAST